MRHISLDWNANVLAMKRPAHEIAQRVLDLLTLVLPLQRKGAARDVPTIFNDSQQGCYATQRTAVHREDGLGCFWRA